MVNSCGIETDPELRKIQQACFEILKRFKKVCNENGFRYYLAYGTLLGAIRHHGYIPWDDDIDIWMPRKDLEGFLEIAEEQMKPFIPNYYSINNKAFFKYRTQLCIEDHAYKVGFKLGDGIQIGYIWIDIIAMDGMPNTKRARKRQCRKFRFWYAIIGLARSSFIGASNIQSKSMLKKIVIKINDIIKLGRLLNIKTCFDKFKNIKIKYDFDSSEYVHGSTSYYTDKAVFPRRCFDGERQEEYEGEMFFIPSGAEEVLTSIYGDYMQIPPENKRERAHFAELASIE